MSRTAHYRLAAALAVAATLVGCLLMVPDSPARATSTTTAQTTAPSTAAAPRTAKPLPTPRGTVIAPRCEFITARRVEPALLLLGETVDVTMTVVALCPGAISPLHVVLVLEGSAAMAGQTGHDAKASAAALVAALDLRDDPFTRVAVVGFDDRVRLKCPLSNDPGRAQRCIDRVGAHGGARLDLGVREANLQLRAARADYDEPDAIREVVVIIAAGHGVGCDKSLRAAGGLKADGVLVITVCAGRDCDVPCIRMLATSPRFFFEWQQRWLLERVFETIRKQFQSIVLKSLTITDQLPMALTILTDTLQPAPTFLDTATGLIRWTQTHVPRDGITVTYRARTTAPGSQPSTLRAGGAYVDNRNRMAAFVFPSALITVLGFEPVEQVRPVAPASPEPLTPPPAATQTPPGASAEPS